MRLFTEQVFDMVLSGTGPWHTSDALTEVLGSPDAFAVQAVATGVSTPAPTLTVVAEHSADSQNWHPSPSPAINQAISNGSTFAGAGQVLLGRMRFKVTMSGSSPACRLKVYVTGRQGFFGVGGE
jgi:S1-C subfamily serine protease